jgi:hypothetical protein
MMTIRRPIWPTSFVGMGDHIATPNVMDGHASTVNIGDFRHWKDHDKYKTSLERVGAISRYWFIMGDYASFDPVPVQREAEEEWGR